MANETASKTTVNQIAIKTRSADGTRAIHKYTKRSDAMRMVKELLDQETVRFRISKRDVVVRQPKAPKEEHATQE